MTLLLTILSTKYPIESPNDVIILSSGLCPIARSTAVPIIEPKNGISFNISEVLINVCNGFLAFGSGFKSFLAGCKGSGNSNWILSKPPTSLPG